METDLPIGLIFPAIGCLKPSPATIINLKVNTIQNFLLMTLLTIAYLSTFPCHAYYPPTSISHCLAQNKTIDQIWSLELTKGKIIFITQAIKSVLKISRPYYLQVSYANKKHLLPSMRKSTKINHFHTSLPRNPTAMILYTRYKALHPSRLLCQIATIWLHCYCFSKLWQVLLIWNNFSLNANKDCVSSKVITDKWCMQSAR